MEKAESVNSKKVVFSTSKLVEAVKKYEECIHPEENSQFEATQKNLSKLAASLSALYTLRPSYFERYVETVSSLRKFQKNYSALEFLLTFAEFTRKMAQAEAVAQQQPAEFELPDELVEQISSAVKVANPLIPAEQQSQFQTEILPRVKECRSKKLSISDILALISLLFTVYFGIIASLPDEQLERISNQTEVIIEQQEEIIELNQKDLELQEALNALTGSINLLTDEVQALRDEVKHFENTSESNAQPDTVDCQN